MCSCNYFLFHKSEQNGENQATDYKGGKEMNQNNRVTKITEYCIHNMHELVERKIKYILQI